VREEVISVTFQISTEENLELDATWDEAGVS
jgi:hypothetical protein